MDARPIFILITYWTVLIYGEISLDIDQSDVCEGTSVTLTCTVDPPQMSMTWRRSGIRIASCSPTCFNQESYHNITFNTTVGIVYIKKTSLIRDGGEWQCMPLGSRGTENKTLTITARASSTMKDKGRLLFTDGMVTNVTCYTGTIDSTVTFAWYIDSTGNVLPGQTSGVINGGTASYLQLTGTKQLNNKTLYCSATNQCGTGNTDNITLDIRYRPTVHVEPSTSPYKIIEGNQLTLTCTVDDSNPQPTSFTWSKDRGSITGQSSSVFRLTSVQRSQAGQYTCTANNGVGTGTSTSVQVDVLYPPTVSTPSIYKIPESDVLSVTCSSTPGNPNDTNYRWTGPDRYRSTGSTLRIADIKRSQTGVYNCTATNIMIPTSTNIQQTGTGTSQTTIDVLYGPTVSVLSESVVIEESNPLTVSCMVDSNPVSTIKWYGLDGRVVSNNKDLVINNINRHQSGIYNCTAITVLQPTNGTQQTKTDSKTVLVDVRYLDPVIIQSDTTDVDEGQPFNLSCSTNSNPIASMTWSSPASNSRQLTTNSINYYKHIADCLDTGIYTCTAVNSHIQKTVTKSQDVNIRCYPRQYPNINHVMRVFGNVSETVLLSVSILAYPQPTFTWYRLDKPININDELYQQVDVINSTNIFMSTLTVKINSSELYGDYKINISNDINHAILIISLTTQSVPDIPSELILDSLSHSSICIKLKPGFDGGDTQEFIFEDSVDNTTWITSSTVTLTSEGDVLNGCIENLNPDTAYFVRVIASNKFGSSKPVQLVTRQPLRTSANPHESDQSEDNTALIVCLCLAIVIIIGLIIGFIYQRRKRSTAEGDNKTSGSSIKNTSNSSIYNSLELNTRTESLPSPYSNLGDASRGDKPVSSPYENLGESSGSKPVTSPYSNLGDASGSYKNVDDASGPYINSGETSRSDPEYNPYINVSKTSPSPYVNLRDASRSNY
ncbi:neural cell adhesion molecule 1 [Patella vulgata]|uniref:neural cell adhesion molecule 1 n=1 Tax=Patella vulgata TaxID=6465 RepID=UPI0024A8C689|nr:neural cell adhesion molecule 1 [Patella vulgata]